LPPPVASVSEAIARMQQVESSLAPDDGVACFNRMYLDVTEQVDEQLSRGGFADGSFVSTLDVVFANLYFAAFDAAAAGGADMRPAGYIQPPAPRAASPSRRKPGPERERELLGDC
jgi:hypothetical protein